MRIFSGEKTLRLIKSKGMTIADFRRALDREPSNYRPTEAYLCKILDKKGWSPNVKYVALFAKVLNCDMNDLMEESSVQPS